MKLTSLSDRTPVFLSASRAAISATVLGVVTPMVFPLISASELSPFAPHNCKIYRWREAPMYLTGAPCKRTSTTFGPVEITSSSPAISDWVATWVLRSFNDVPRPYFLNSPLSCATQSGANTPLACVYEMMKLLFSGGAPSCEAPGEGKAKASTNKMERNAERYTWLRPVR